MLEHMGLTDEEKRDQCAAFSLAELSMRASELMSLLMNSFTTYQRFVVLIFLISVELHDHVLHRMVHLIHLYL